MTQVNPPNGPLKSVAEFIDLREQLEQRNATVPPSGRWAYPGQPRDFGSLSPSFQRQFSKQPSETAQIIEGNLIQAFRKHCAALRDRSADMPSPEQIAPGHDLHCLSVMQHYEIPTRLLDWTADFWTALYFACSNDPGNDAEVWFYERELFTQQRASNPSLAALMDRSPNPPDEPQLLSNADGMIVELDPQISPTMREQLAHHTVSTNVFSDHALLLQRLDTGSPSPDGNSPRRVHRALIDGCHGSRTISAMALRFPSNNDAVMPNPAIERTSSGLQPPSAAHVKR